MNIKLSVIIADYKDKYSIPTIQSLLDNSALGDALEIIMVMDGQWAEFKLIHDPRVRYIHVGSNGGMRRSYNTGIRIARGEFFMRLDEHCSFAKGYDKELTDTCKENEVMTARRYYLDPVKWEVMKDKGFVDYEDLTIQNVSEGVRKFAGKPNREKMKARKDIMIDETFAMQGSMWVANTEFFRKTVGELETNGYGPAYQDSVEVCMKYWEKGGRLMLNKNTWFAHKHRDFSRTHNEGTEENPWIRNDSWTYALNQWEDYYTKELLPKWSKI